MGNRTRACSAAVRRFFATNFSLSFLYPLLGTWFFLRHRYLWPLLKARLLPVTLLSLCIVTFMFFLTYLPQVALLMLFHNRGSAWVNGTFLVLNESNLLVSILFETFLVDKAQVDVFDAVLVAKGHAELVSQRRPIDETQSDPVKCLGPREKGATFAPFSLRQIVEFIVLLPMNFVPYVGVPLFLFLTGYRAGPLLQYRYCVFKGMDRKQRKAFAKQKSMRWQYTWFGTVFLTLQLVPVLSMFFLLTTAAGSALWASDIEDKAQNSRLSSHAGLSDEVDAPPAYTDEP